MVALVNKYSGLQNVIQNFAFPLIIVALATSFFFAFIACFWSRELQKYIKDKYPEKWMELSSGFQINFMKFQMATEDSEDPIINLYRRRYQKYSKIWKISMVIVFLCIGLLGILGLC